ncbi:MAG TPA: D-2-hydroxyacid dehydrogenase [Burkholderiaceae bacterium]|nr:D-2-hydroxyacid dehydrogenase [Burkholderiaceae bacterium]
MPHQNAVVATLPASVRPFLEGHLPPWLQVRWWSNRQEALALAPGAEIGWFDMYDKEGMSAAVTGATDMRWLSSMIAGMEHLPLDTLHKRRVTVTNGAGINAVTIAEYVVMGMLTIAKGYREVVRAQDRHDWLKDAPGKIELAGSRALVLGYGTIGKLVQRRLQAFEVDVTVVRRQATGAANVLGPRQWRARLGDFDWVILAVPATDETRHMIGADELAAMKRSAVLLNVARGSVVDQDALVHALQARSIGAAFLDVMEPEPLSADHVLWTLDNAHITMHLSGRSQDRMVERAARRFIDNLALYRAGEPLHFKVDLTQGY